LFVVASFAIAASAGALIVRAAAPTAPSSNDVDWAFPSGRAPVRATPNPAAIATLRGSPVRYSRADLKSGFLAIDWWPTSHDRLPEIVRIGRSPTVLACGYCHLPDGEGRPENAALAGLSTSYIAEQVRAMRSGARRGVRPAWLPTAVMTQLAHFLTAEEVTHAASYFSKRTFVGHTRVVESANIPAVEADAFVYRRLPGGARQQLGSRIIEVPDDFDRFDLRDSTVGYVAYVPPGAIARGRFLATTNDGRHMTACMACHGSQLQGSAIAPPLAGRSPTALFRQLDGFRTGSRHSAVMQAEVSSLSMSDMIAVAAYAGSVKLAKASAAKKP
jgi:cytochrome c553